MLDGTVLIANLFLWLCKGIYWLAEKAYELLLDIANVQIFDSETLQVLSQRIYIFLGIIMLFKVAFSLINYIINPDSFTDKGKGVGKLIIDIAVVLLLIVSVPFIFEYAMKFQRAVLNQNVIPNLVLGMSNDAEGQFDYGDEGEKMSFTVFSSFFRVNPAIFEENPECLDGLFESGEVDTETENSYGGSLIMKEECAEVLDAASGSSLEGSISSAIAYAYELNNINIFTDSDIIKSKSTVGDEKLNTFDFMGLIATASGIFLAWIFVMFCFDIAIRTVKLVFLQLIAPIPIVSYIDPKGQKGMFKKWVNVCVKTYLDLFIRLIAVFFAIFIVSQIPNAEIMIPGDESEKVSGFVYVFLIFGVLLFAKQLPKLLEDMTGVKLDGGFTLNPMNRLRQMPILSKAAAGFTGSVVGAAVGVAAAKESGTSKWRGAAKGAIYGGRDATSKFSFGGGDGKKQGIIGSAGNRAMRELVGHDFAQQSFLRKWGTKEARERDEKLKKAQGIYGQQIGALNASNSLLASKQEKSYEEASDIVKKYGGDHSTFKTIEEAVKENKIDKLSGNDRFVYEQAKQQFNDYISINEEMANNNKLISDYQRNIEDLGKERASVKASAGLDDVKKSKADRLIDEAFKLNQK